MPLVSSMCKASTKLQKLTGSIDGIWNRSRTPPSCYAFLGVERVETYIRKRISSNFGFGSFEIGFLIFLTEIIPAFLLRWNSILTRWAAPATLNMQRSTTQLYSLYDLVRNCIEYMTWPCCFLFDTDSQLTASSSTCSILLYPMWGGTGEASCQSAGGKDDEQTDSKRTFTR